MRLALLERVNPFVKAVTVLVCGILLAFTGAWQLNLVVMAVCFAALALGSHCRWSTFFKTFCPAILIAAAVFVSGLSFGKADGGTAYYNTTTIGAALLLSTCVLAYVGLGLLFALSTDQEEFVVSLMHHCHLKPKFAYGVLAAVHLIPTLQREWQEVRLAYQVRGKKAGPLSIGPLFNALVNGVRWSENVAMAMESKGFDGDGPRTFSVVTKITAADICFGIVCIVLTLAGVILL